MSDNPQHPQPPYAQPGKPMPHKQLEEPAGVPDQAKIPDEDEPEEYSDKE